MKKSTIAHGILREGMHSMTTQRLRLSITIIGAIALLCALGCGNSATPTDDATTKDSNIPPTPDSETVTPDPGGDDPTGPPPDSVVGKPCSGNTDCESDEPGWCIEGKDGNVCTQECIADCPPGWTCKQVDVGGGDLTFVCAPLHVPLCRPCTTNSECASAGFDPLAFCHSYGDAGSYCATPCGDTAPCPSGHACEATQGPIGLTDACVLSAGECACDNIAIAQQWSTTCNPDGSACPGTRECTAEGLSACDATETPSADTCNGVDDDCDGITDEDFASFTTICGVGVCAALGSTACVNGQESDNCVPGIPAGMDGCNGVDDDCDGEKDEDGQGNPCTVTNLYGSCSGVHECQGNTSVCVAPTPNACGCGDPATGCAIGAVCFQPDAVKPGNSCEVCDPAQSITSWSTPADQSCNDANLCTYNDKCVNGTCSGTPASCEDDACALKSCNGTSECTKSPKGVPVYESESKGWHYGYAPVGVISYRVVGQNQAVYLLSAPIPDKIQSTIPNEFSTCDWCGCVVSPEWCVYTEIGSTVYTSSSQLDGTLPLHRWARSSPLQHRSAFESPGTDWKQDQFLGYACVP